MASIKLSIFRSICDEYNLPIKQVFEKTFQLNYNSQGISDLHQDVTTKV